MRVKIAVLLYQPLVVKWRILFKQETMKISFDDRFAFVEQMEESKRGTRGVGFK